MGGGQGVSDLRGLLFLQAGLVPIAFGIAAFCIYGFVHSQGWTAGTKAMWRAIPQWQVFIYLLLHTPIRAVRQRCLAVGRSLALESTGI